MSKSSLIRIRRLLVIFVLLHAALQSGAQTVAVHGTIATSATPVKNASVSFTEMANPANVVSALSDSLGQYHLNITLTSVVQATALPAKFELQQNYPNPFTSSTAIPYQLKSESDVLVTIYDILGRVVQESSVGAQVAGTHSILWDGRNSHGQKVAPGVYFYSLKAGGETSVRKMILNGGGLGAPPSIISGTLPAQIAAVGSPKAGPLGVYSVRVENGAGAFPLIATKQIDSVRVIGDSTLNISVNNQNPIPVTTIATDSLQQSIRGFGGANIIPWRPAMTGGQMQTAYGAGDGQLGFTIFRLRIPYTDDVNEFSAQLQVAQLAQSYGAIVFASPWTPPPAMKNNNNIVAGVLNDTSYVPYAAHLKNFADYMSTNGAPLYAISVQNEPDASVTYESCSWNAVQMRTFMKNNAPTVGVRVMMPESQNFVRALSDSTLNDSTAAAQTAIIAGHIYGGGLSAYPLAVSKGKEVWMTEHLDLDTSWAGVLGTGKEIHDCMNAGWNAYVWWYIVRYYGPIGETGLVTKRGYVMSQYSRFVRPGYYKVKCNATPQRNVYVTSYRDNATSKVVIVAINVGTVPVQQTFAITNGSMASFARYATSQTKNCLKGSDIPASSGSMTATLEPSSIVTFVSN